MQVDRKEDGWVHAVGEQSLAQSVVYQAIWDYKALVNAGYISYGRVTVTYPEKSKLPVKVMEIDSWHEVRMLMYWFSLPDTETHSLQWWLDAGGVTDTDARTIRMYLYSQGYFEDIKSYDLSAMEGASPANLEGMERNCN